MSDYTIKDNLCANISFSSPTTKPIVTISNDGKVKVNPDLSVDEAAREFWNAVERAYPQFRDAVLRTVPDVDPTDRLFVGYSNRTYERRMYGLPGMAEAMGLIDVKEYVRVKKDEPKVAYAMTKNGNPL